MGEAEPLWMLCNKDSIVEIRPYTIVGGTEEAKV